MSQVIQGGSPYRRLKRASAVGLMAVMVWVCLGGGYLLLRIGDAFGWVVLAVGLVLLISPAIPQFRWYWNADTAPQAFPAIILIANAVLIIFSGTIAWVYLRDPFLTYNDVNTIAAIVFGVAAALSLLALVANVAALQLDRRAG